MSADAVTAGLDLADDLAKIVLQKDEQKNTPEMVEAKKNQTEAQAVDAEVKAVANQDVEQIRKNISE